VKRFESAFSALGLDFHKTRPDRLFLKKMGSEPADMLPPSSIERFESLFSAISGAHTKVTNRDSKPFV
jgi:hypothetical protein